jgi:hypothetical protein
MTSPEPDWTWQRLRSTVVLLEGQCAKGLSTLPMSVEIHVDAYSGYKANERPISFWLDPDINNLTGVYEIETGYVEVQGYA